MKAPTWVTSALPCRRLLSAANSDSRSCIVQPPWSQWPTSQLPCRRGMGAGEAISRASCRYSGSRPSMLMPNGFLRRPGDPTFVYREGGVAIAGVWESGPDAAVVRSGTTEKAPIIGRIVPAWNNDQLRLTIEPAGAAAVKTTVFERAPGD